MWGVATAIASSMVLLLGSCVCTQIGCPSNVQFKLPLVPLDAAARFEDASVEVCHNDVCGMADLPAPPTMHQFSAGVEVEDPIHTSVGVRVTRFESKLGQYEVGYTVEVVIDARDAVLVNGDVFTAIVTAADGSVVTSATFRANYRDYYPNGEHCDGRPCRVAVLEPR